MNVQTKKLELVQLILNTDKPALLEKVSQLLKQDQKTDWWDEIPETIQESIEIALDQADRDETVLHQDVIQEARAKYTL